MRILLANGTAYPVIGGVENSLRYIGRELLRAGHEVKIFCLQYTHEEPLKMVYDGIEIIRYPYRPERWPHKQFLNTVNTVQMGVKDVLKSYNPNQVWSRSSMVSLGIRLSGYSGTLINIFCTNARMNCQGLFLNTKGLPLKRRLLFLLLWPSAYLTSYYLEKKLVKQCYSVTFSKNMCNQLKKSYSKHFKDCKVISPGVETEIFSRENGARFFNEIKSRYGLISGDKIVLYAGRLSSAKNIPLLMTAVSRLELEAKLVLVGCGPEEERLRNFALKVGISDRVIFAGKQVEMLPGFYSISKVCVLPTTIESFGQVFLESLACGTPVIGFAGNSHKIMTATDEIIRDGVTGYIVKNVNATSLAESINKIFAMHEVEYKKMSQNAVDDVKKKYSWRKFVNVLLIETTK